MQWIVSCDSFVTLLSRAWGLSSRTHSALIAPVCGLLQLKVELACQCAGFITKCLHSVNHTLRFISTQEVYSQRMRSPIGRNAQYCADLFEVNICNIAAITKRMAWIRAEVQLSNSDYDTLRVISELVCVQHHYMNLDTFSMADVADMIETLQCIT